MNREVSYWLYPQWLQARSSLVQAVHSATREDRSAEYLATLVDAWFHRHVFEVGTRYCVDLYAVSMARMDLRAMAEEKVSHVIAQEIARRGLIQKRVLPTRGQQIEETDYSLLVFAPAILGVEPATPSRDGGIASL